MLVWDSDEESEIEQPSEDPKAGETKIEETEDPKAEETKLEAPHVEEPNVEQFEKQKAEGPKAWIEQLIAGCEEPKVEEPNVEPIPQTLLAPLLPFPDVEVGEVGDRNPDP